MDVDPTERSNGIQIKECSPDVTFVGLLLEIPYIVSGGDTWVGSADPRGLTGIGHQCHCTLGPHVRSNRLEAKRAIKYKDGFKPN